MLKLQLADVAVWVMSAFALGVACTFVVRRLAFALGVVDHPHGERKVHTHPTPLLGGVGIFFAFWVTWLLARNYFDFAHIGLTRFWGLFFAGAVIMVGGYLDDKYILRARYQIIAPVCAVVIALTHGIRAQEITNPFGGTLTLTVLASVALSVVWLMGMMYTTKLLDGLDGLATGVSAIAALTIGALALFTKYYQPDMAVLALILCGVLIGFLIFNFHPAKIFLGEGGSTWVGFMLGAFAIMSGSKIVTTVLVMGVPILDVVWVIGRRLIKEHKSPFSADRLHLHYRLLDTGLSVRQAVGVFYALSLAFGLASLFLLSFQKFQALGALLVIMALLALVVTKKAR